MSNDDERDSAEERYNEALMHDETELEGRAFSAGERAEAENAYLECALWSSVDEAGEPLDDNYGPDDCDPASLAAALAELAEFVSMTPELEGLEPAQIGHDFWLTRNRHGAGFWDRGLGARGDRLSDDAKAYGSSDVYVGDDGRLYFT